MHFLPETSTSSVVWSSHWSLVCHLSFATAPTPSLDIASLAQYNLRLLQGSCPGWSIHLKRPEMMSLSSHCSGWHESLHHRLCPPHPGIHYPSFGVGENLNCRCWLNFTECASNRSWCTGQGWPCPETQRSAAMSRYPWIHRRYRLKRSGYRPQTGSSWSSYWTYCCSIISAIASAEL